MNKTLQRTLAILLCVIMLIPYPSRVFAADEDVDDSAATELGTYTFDEYGNLIETPGEDDVQDLLDQTDTSNDSTQLETDTSDNNLVAGNSDDELDSENDANLTECKCLAEDGLHDSSCEFYVDQSSSPDNSEPNAESNPDCTCETTNDEHLDYCLLYVEPSSDSKDLDESNCDCGTDTDIHSETCPKYKKSETEKVPCDDVAPIDVYEQLLSTSTLLDFWNILNDEVESVFIEELSEEQIDELIYHVGLISDDEDLEIEILMFLYELPNAPLPPWKTLENTYIYFDLAAGNVTITASSYSGYVYIDGVATAVTGTHVADNEYYVYQSNLSNSSLEYDANGVPVYDRVSCNGVSWGQYITNNTDISGIVNNWASSAQAVGRSSTGNYINVTGGSTYNVIVENIWSSYISSSTKRTTAGIGFTPSSGGVLTLYLKGDNRVGNIHYYSSLSNAEIIFQDGESDGQAGSITCASFNGSSNHYNSVIGGCDTSYEAAYGITINGGIIYAGSQTGDNCSAIGGGGNGYGKIYINGGTVTAVANSSGAAIGGGIGESAQGGNAYVSITGGTVYAYNFGYVSNMSGTKYFIPAAAIGGGSSCKSDGNASTTIDISGGYVFAQSLGGAAIGGGSSTMKAGGAATINISGGAVVEAQSISGTATNGDAVNHGVSIGGGTAGAAGKSNGGNITLNISGGSLHTGSIGGGNCVNSTGAIGSGTVTITGGTISGQVVMGAGSVAKNIFKMTGGTINNINATPDGPQYPFAEPYGGAVYLEYGDAEIDGGIIKNCHSENGGAIYIEGGDFQMKSGSIMNCTSINGGAVHINTGSFTMSGGEMHNNSATNGGAVYVNGGGFSIYGGSFYENSATDGGAAYIRGGNVNLYNGTFNQNDAVTNGGAIYVNTNSVDVTINVFDGEITNNTAGNHGGAIGANADGDCSIALNIGLEECKGHNSSNHDDLTCPQILNNTASKLGGAFCMHGNRDGLSVNIYCGYVTGNIAIRNPGSNSLNQGGGNVEVWGGRIDPGIMVGGGAYTDNRLESEQIILRFWSNYDGGPTTPHMVEVTAGVTVTFPLDTYVRDGHELSGWATAPDASGLYVPANGQHAISESEDGYLDFYAAWDIESTYIIYIPDTLLIDESQSGSVNINADINYFKANSNLNVFIDSDFILDYDRGPISLEYQISSNEFGAHHIISRMGIVATFQYNNKTSKVLTATILPNQDEQCCYSGYYTDIITFIVEYAEIIE